MTRHVALILAVSLCAVTSLGAQRMNITPNGARPSTPGDPKYFTGLVFVEILFAATAQTHATGGQVTFTPGARSAWHTHPAGQTLIVTAGSGWVQEWGGTRREIKAGDVVWTPPGVKHWHGAAPESTMTHIAIQESVGGKNVEWLEQVSEEQYTR